MVKYSHAFKLRVVKDYLNGKGTFRAISKEHGLPGNSQIQDWVHVYRRYGAEGLLPQRGKNHYTTQFKRDAVELYLTKQKTSQEIAFELGMKSPAQLRGWVSAFRAKGMAGLSGTKGTLPAMKRKNKKMDAHATPADAERIKELENQVLALQIQNAFLKELRSLQTKESQEATNKLPESSTDSENNSN